MTTDAERILAEAAAAEEESARRRDAAAGVPDEVVRVAADFRDYEFARLFVFSFGVAAKQYPEEIRTACSVAFDTTAIEEAHRRLLRGLAETQAELAALRHDVQDARKWLGQIEAHSAALADDYLILRRRCGAMQTWLNRKAKELTPNGAALPRATT